MTKQPQWHCVAQLGDVSPLDHGGYWILEDTTGVYPPEGELLDVGEESEPLTVYRFILEPCTFVDGILSDNSFHPDHPAWFADSLTDIARANEMEPGALVALFTSDDSSKLAIAWRMVGEYWGFDNLDNYPITLPRREAAQRYNQEHYRI